MVIIAFIAHRSSFLLLLFHFQFISHYFNTLSPHTPHSDQRLIILNIQNTTFMYYFYWIVCVCARQNRTLMCVCVQNVCCATYFDYGNCCKSSIKRLTLFPFALPPFAPLTLGFCNLRPNIFHCLLVSHCTEYTGGPELKQCKKATKPMNLQ